MHSIFIESRLTKKFVILVILLTSIELIYILFIELMFRNFFFHLTNNYLNSFLLNIFSLFNNF
jgi:hypothetical protein